MESVEVRCGNTITFLNREGTETCIETPLESSESAKEIISKNMKKRNVREASINNNTTACLCEKGMTVYEIHVLPDEKEIRYLVEFEFRKKDNGRATKRYFHYPYASLNRAINFMRHFELAVPDAYMLTKRIIITTEEKFEKDGKSMEAMALMGNIISHDVWIRNNFHVNVDLEIESYRI